jgi:hypothetical protein
MAGQGLLYNFSFPVTTSGTSSVDVMVLGTTAAVPILIHEIRLTSQATTDVRLNLQLLRRTTGPTGGTTVTGKPLNKRNTVAAASTFTYLDTTPGTAGDILENEQWSVLVPFSRIYTPDERIYVPVSGWIALFFATAPGSASNISGNIVAEEL